MEDLAARFVTAFNDADFDTIRALLADEVVAYVTTDDGGQTHMTGADAYVASLRTMLTSVPATWQIALTQQPAMVDDSRLLLMIEVQAERNGNRLHNYSAQLFTVSDGHITEIRMTDAKPAESARFWA